MSVAKAALGVGLAGMVAASIWAPARPELLNTADACNVAMCGTLEDPQRWRAAWFIWLAGATTALVDTGALARPRPGRGWRRLGLAALVVVCLPVSAFVGERERCVLRRPGGGAPVPG